MSGGFGIGPFGLSPFGISGPLYLVSAVAQSTNTVRVTCSVPPLALASTNTGDALNPSTWTVTRLDSGAIFTIASVTQIDAVIFDLSLFQPLGAFNITHRVSAPTLTKPTGALIVSPSSLDFPGVAQEPQTLSQQATVFVDVANPPTPNLLGQLSGTLVVTSSGDYDSVSGIQLIKKLILRRLSTPTGGFKHLPAYGIGLPLKQPVRTSDLVGLKVQVVNQCLLEPDVATAAATITLDPANGVLQIQVTATQAVTDEKFFLSTNIPLGGG